MCRRHLRIILVISVLLGKTSVFAQNDPSSTIDLRYSSEIVSDLSFYNGNINSIVQDNDGFMWIGSWVGLFMYNGYSVRPYMPKPGFKECFKGRKIRTIYNDSRGRVWVGSSLQGLHLFDRNEQCFIQFLNDPNDDHSIPENDIMGIWEDSQQNIWIATTNGFISKITEGARGEFEFTNIRFHEGTTDFLSIFSSEDDIVWIGSSNGLIRFDSKEFNGQNSNGLLEKIFISQGNIPISTINTIFVYNSENNSKRSIWLGTLQGLVNLEYQDGAGVVNQSRILINSKNQNNIQNRINAIFQSEEEKEFLWIGTDGGMKRVNLKTGQPVGFSYVFDSKAEDGESEKITTFCEDRSGVVWVGTNKGIRKINIFKKEFEHIGLKEELGDQVGEIKGLAKTNNEIIYVATHGLGVGQIDLRDKAPTIQPIRIDESGTGLKFINSIGVDAFHNIWAGTNGNGIYRINSSKIKDGFAEDVTYFSNDVNDTTSISDDYIYSACTDQKGNFWVGTYQGGLNRYDAENNKFIIYNSVQGLDFTLSQFPIIDMVQDANQNIWIGTRGNGLYYFRPSDKAKAGSELFYHISAADTAKNRLFDNFITDLFLDQSNHRLWVGSESGLSCIDLSTLEIKSYSHSNGFPGDLVQSIVSIHENELWISSRKGIIKMEFVDGFDANNIEYREYSFSDGIENKFFNNNAGIGFGDRVFFGGLNGVTFFNPKNIKNNPYEPMVALVDFELSHKSVPIGKLSDGRTVLPKNINELDHITLKHSDKILTFEFVALHYAAPEKNTFAFMIEGFDESWIYTDANRRYAHYTNLPPGDYTFKVKAANNDGVWGMNEKSIDITILPPFWTTGWAYLLYTLFLIGTFLIIRKVTISQIKLRHKVQIEKLERERSDEIHNLELQYFTNISHEIRTPLTLILGPLEKILQMPDLNARLSNQLQLMQHHGQRLYRLLNQLMEFRKKGKGELKLRAADGNIVKFINEIYISFRENALDRRINYLFQTEKNIIQLFFDRDMFEKIFYNLLSNAFKYTPDQGNIAIDIKILSQNKVQATLEKENTQFDKVFPSDYLCVSISDTGHGISRGDLEHIFERFFRAGLTESKSTIGTGIGLTLTKELILIHKGIIAVESELSKGSVFKVLFPLGKDYLEEDEIIQNFKDSENVENYLPHLAEKNEQIKANQVITENGEEEFERSTLLIVEDNEDVRKYIKDIFSKNYNIIEAVNGEDGIEKAIDEIPDLIISDVMMPVKDGIELCSQLKKSEHTSHIPIILLTARTSLIFKVEGIETGADDYITKPFSPQLLGVRVRNLIEQRKNLKRRFSDKLYVKPKEITLNSLDEKFLQKVIEMVEENMGNSEYGIDDLCSDLGMSRIQLYRKLKALTGLSANEFIRSQRLQRAAQLLNQNQLNISQITYEVGFNDLKYFRSRFQEHFGMTPSDYIKDKGTTKADSSKVKAERK